MLSDLHDRGIDNILINSIENLNGFDQSIATAFLHAEIQTWIVRQVRNTMKYVASKDSKTVMADVKKVYQAASKEIAEEQLNELEKKWDKKYPAVIKSWRNNWHKLYTFFKYPAAIRKLVYTTNTFEGYHRQIRKVTKTKGAFPSDMALLKRYTWHRAHQRKVVNASCQLGSNGATIKYYIWRENEIYALKIFTLGLPPLRGRESQGD